nr:PREDICTED: tyrosine--tRNA ligase 2, cytoplasmic [Daucus carota subsp. sativus]
MISSLGFELYTHTAAAAAQQEMANSEEKMKMIMGNDWEECCTQDELLHLLANKPLPVFLDRFEPSGKIPLAQGVVKAINVKKMIAAGCQVKVWMADIFAQLNNKLGGDMNKIQVAGKYFVEILKALGVNLEDEKFKLLWASKETDSQSDVYWPLVLNIARGNTVSGVERCIKLMGLCEHDELNASHIVYTVMQCADIFFLEADICQTSMDQMEVNVLAREYSEKIKRENKPVILSHHVISALQQGQEKKNDPSCFIFMDDEEADVNVKIKKAYCPPVVVNENPCLEYIRYIIFPWFSEFVVERGEKNGGNKTFSSFEELISDYESGRLHPGDLKPALTKAINKILQPVREHFKKDAAARDLLKRVKGYKVSKDPPVEKIPVASDIESQSVELQDEELSSELLSDGLNQMSIEDRKFNTVRSIGEECIKLDELKNLLAKKPEPIAYDGFEPSGRMHVAQGILKAINVNKLTSADCRVKIWVADWFAQLNNKLGGDLNKIQTVGNYFVEIWKALGMKLEEGKVEFLLSSKEINSRSNEYWPLVLDIARKNTLSRIIKCGQIMGRSDKDQLTAAQILYPCMQCADIFFLKADICQLGMDQRKVNVLAREYCLKIKRKNKPIILSHHMIPGLQPGQEKMSKSDPSSAIFMEDEEESVNMKIQKAHCPPNVVSGNPCLEYIKYIIFPWFSEFSVSRSQNDDTIYNNFKALSADYESGEVQPSDLKHALAKALNQILQPVRDHFQNDPDAKDLLKRVKSYQITR